MKIFLLASVAAFSLLAAPLSLSFAVEPVDGCITPACDDQFDGEDDSQSIVTPEIGAAENSQIRDDGAFTGPDPTPSADGQPGADS